MKDEGTLKEIGAQVGDVVLYVGTDATAENRPRTYAGIHVTGKHHLDGQEWGGCDHMNPDGPWRIISRAADAKPVGPIRADRTIPVFVREGYDSLFTTLAKALHQAQDGKGKDRHAQPGQAFEDQPIIQIGRMVGMGFQNGQAIKKMVEAQGMLARGDYNAAEREVLGAINYLAAVAIEINQRATAQQKEE